MIELGLLSWGLCTAAGAVADPHMELRSWILLGGADEGFGVPKGVLGTWWPWGEVVSWGGGFSPGYAGIGDGWERVGCWSPLAAD